jgi:hypothetical protein
MTLHPASHPGAPWLQMNTPTLPSLWITLALTGDRLGAVSTRGWLQSALLWLCAWLSKLSFLPAGTGTQPLVIEPETFFQSGIVVHTCNPNYSRGGGKRIQVWGQLRQKHETLSEKNLKAKSAGGVAPASKWQSTCLAPLQKFVVIFSPTMGLHLSDRQDLNSATTDIFLHFQSHLISDCNFITWVPTPVK